MLLVIIILILLFGGGFGWYGHSCYGPRWGLWAGPGFGLGTILIILLILYLLGLVPGRL